MRTVPINGEPCHTLGIIYICTVRQLTASDLARSAMGKRTAMRVEIARATSDLPVSERSRLLSLYLSRADLRHWMSLGSPGPDLRICWAPPRSHMAPLRTAFRLHLQAKEGWYYVYCYFSVVLFLSLLMMHLFVLFFLGLALLGFLLLFFMAAAFPFSRFRCLS